MNPKLRTSLGQRLMLTPQLRQAIELLQLSNLELEAQIASAVESNPLLDWAELDRAQPDGAQSDSEQSDHSDAAKSTGTGHFEPPDHQSIDQSDHSFDSAEADPSASSGDIGFTDADWSSDRHDWNARHYPGDPDHTHAQGDATERIAAGENLHGHLLWQLHLTRLGNRDRSIGAALIDAIDDDGYLRESLATIATWLAPEFRVNQDEVRAVLHQVQQFDPPGVGARDLGECLRLQLAALPVDTASRALAIKLVDEQIERLPRLDIPALARELNSSVEQAASALRLLRTLHPRPGNQIGTLPADTYIQPDCVIWRQHGVWQVTLADSHRPKPIIQSDYAQMLAADSAGADAAYLREHLQSARWLLKNIQAREQTLLSVVRCVVREQSDFLEYGVEALRPLTRCDVATKLDLHESTISRAVARKYVHIPSGIIPLHRFFASGIAIEGGSETSNRAIQEMIRRIIDAEDPHNPLSDARLARALEADGVPVARRTVAKYRTFMNIPSSHDRIRLG